MTYIEKVKSNDHKENVTTTFEKEDEDSMAQLTQSAQDAEVRSGFLPQPLNKLSYRQKTRKSYTRACDNICKYCGKMFQTSLIQRVHINRYHADIKDDDNEFDDTLKSVSALNPLNKMKSLKTSLAFQAD